MTQVTENQKPQTVVIKRTKLVWKGFFIRLSVLFFLIVLGYSGYFGYKIYRLQKNIVEPAPVVGEKEVHKGVISAAKAILGSNREKLKGEEDGRINILLLGMGGEGHKGRYLTDTIMLVSINPETYESSMLSIPRDLYVRIPDTGGIHTKINAVYTFELRNQENSQGESFASMKKVIKEITGQNIHYYLALNFEGFKRIIDELGGVDVEVKDDIYDPRYPGPNYSYETFEISKGFHHLDAETALKYARVRHTKGGDFGRAERQQQVIASAKRKAFSIKTIANPPKIIELMDILGDNLKTDIQIGEIPSFIHFAKNVNIYQTTTKVLDAWSRDSLLGSTHVEMGGVQAYVLIPRARNYSQVHDLANNIFDLKKLQQKQTLIENEDASLLAIYQTSRDKWKIKNIFNKLGYNIKVESSSNFPNCNFSQNTLLSISPERKLFTLDDLAVKLDATVEYLEDVNSKHDIAICLSKNTVDYFEKQYQNQEDIDQKLIDQTIIQENGTVLYSKETN